MGKPGTGEDFAGACRQTEGSSCPGSPRHLPKCFADTAGGLVPPPPPPPKIRRLPGSRPSSLPVRSQNPIAAPGLAGTRLFILPEGDLWTMQSTGRVRAGILPAWARGFLGWQDASQGFCPGRIHAAVPSACAVVPSVLQQLAETSPCVSPEHLHLYPHADPTAVPPEQRGGAAGAPAPSFFPIKLISRTAPAMQQLCSRHRRGLPALPVHLLACVMRGPQPRRGDMARQGTVPPGRPRTRQLRAGLRAAGASEAAAPGPAGASPLCPGAVEASEVAHQSPLSSAPCGPQPGARRGFGRGGWRGLGTGLGAVPASSCSKCPGHRLEEIPAQQNPLLSTPQAVPCQRLQRCKRREARVQIRQRLGVLERQRWARAGKLSLMLLSQDGGRRGQAARTAWMAKHQATSSGR